MGACLCFFGLCLTIYFMYPIVSTSPFLGFSYFRHHLYRLPGLIDYYKNPRQSMFTIDWTSSNAFTSESISRVVLDEEGSIRRSRRGSSKPNIIVIVADDLGINDLGAHTKYTPSIHSLIKDGVSFVNAYAGHATCSPSRACLLTGRFPSRFGYESTPIPAALARFISVSKSNNKKLKSIWNGDNWRNVPAMISQGMPSTNLTTIPELLGREANYKTIFLGKWQ